MSAEDGRNGMLITEEGVRVDWIVRPLQSFFFLSFLFRLLANRIQFDFKLGRKKKKKRKSIRDYYSWPDITKDKKKKWEAAYGD